MKIFLTKNYIKDILFYEKSIFFELRLDNKNISKMERLFFIFDLEYDKTHNNILTLRIESTTQLDKLLPEFKTIFIEDNKLTKEYIKLYYNFFTEYNYEKP